MILLYVMMGLLKEIIIIFLLVLLHEISHVLVAKSCDIQVEAIELYPFGGVARLEQSIGIDPYTETVIAIAGPLNNFMLLGIGGWLFRRGIFNPHLVQIFLDFNLSLALFNLIPALPLDGGRICRAYLTQKIGYRRATEKLCRFGKNISVFMLCAGVGISFIWGVMPGMLFFPAILYLASLRELKGLPYTLMRHLFSKRKSILSGNILPTIEIAAKGTVTLRQISEYFLPGKYHIVRIYDDHGTLLGKVSESEIMTALFRGQLERSLKDLL